MTTLIISDLHLYKYCSKKCEFLKSLFSSPDIDKIVLCGDFWEGKTMAFTDFLESPWNCLFQPMRERETTYLFGNHDPEMWSDHRTYRFCSRKGDQHKIQVGQKTLVARHGHDIVYLGDDERDPMQYHIPNTCHKIAYSVLGRYYFNVYHPLLNAKAIKKWPMLADNESEILMMGHTHSAQFVPESRYINTGFTDYGHSSFLLIENEQLHLVHAKY